MARWWASWILTVTLPRLSLPNIRTLCSIAPSWWGRKWKPPDSEIQRMKVEKGKVRAPEIGRVWLNSTPLSFRQLRGRAVLVDFWDYTCVNCIRTLPYVQAWHERYRDKGLTVIGVHTPEFTFAQYESNVERGIREFGLTYPIVIDSDREIWKAFANRYWPTRNFYGRLIPTSTCQPSWSPCARQIKQARSVTARPANSIWDTVAGGSATKVDSRKIRLPTTFSPESRKKISSTPVDAGHRPPSTSRLPKPGRIFCA